MAFRKSFPPLIGGGAKVLILGSMPGQRSLDECQYYAHPRNSFWWIMTKLFKLDPDMDYETRCQALVSRNIALWDVCSGCEREGSLDSRILKHTVIANNFEDLFCQFTKIEKVYFNGRAAENLFRQRVMNQQKINTVQNFFTLPSTSPAYASMRPEQKLTHWSVIFDALSENGISDNLIEPAARNQ